MSRTQYLGLLLAAFAGGAVVSMVMMGFASAHAAAPQEVKIVDWPNEVIKVKVEWPNDAVKAKIDWPSDDLEVKLTGPTSKGRAIAVQNHGN